jgi:asparagine synthase (glutamine-hydrolysing)
MSRICGIAGPGEGLESMLAASAAGARGPAARAEGHGHRDEGIALGWHGLGPAQVQVAGDVVCVLDGSVFNRRELDPAGEHESDTALLAHLYRRHGFPEAVRLINGEFAIALWDAGDGTLWLARDRIGIRPLYYATADPGLAFASRPRPLLGLPGVGKELDQRFVGVFAGSHYRYFDNRPEGSPYRDVAQLPAGHVLRVRGGDALATRYWDLAESPDLPDSGEELAERYRELLLDAVGIRFDSAENPAFTLSGGMDSSSVLASAVHLSGERQHAYSTLYSGSEYDESEEIRSMLDAAVHEWHQVPVDAPDVLDLVARMIDSHDEPVATATWLAHYVLCEQVADDGFRTLFGGLGGDELNAGEYEYFFFRFADLRRAGDEETLRHEVAEWARHHDHPVFKKDWDVMEDGLRRMVDLTQPGRILVDRNRLERYRGAIRPKAMDLGRYEPILDHPFTSFLKNRTYQDVFRETAPCCLRAEDRQTRAFGLTNHDPFYDHRLLELMFRVGGHHKIADGVTKRLLREATTDILPAPTRERIKKTGWNAPADQWFSGAGRDMVLELVGDPGFRAGEIYDVDAVRRLADEHDAIVTSGRPAENHMMFFWQLVNLELWLRWLDGV